MIDALPFAACYVYSPLGSGSVSRRSRLLRAVLKRGDAAFLARFARRVRRVAGANPELGEFFGPATLLVPIPGCRPRMGTASTAELLVRALLSEGLGGGQWCGLRRACPVRKSATALAGSRPTIETHYDSFAVESCPVPTARVVLVDDVVTKGRTLIAAAARLREALPSAHIQAFALLRTMGLAEGVDCLLDPCVGEIRWRRGEALRNP